MAACTLWCYEKLGRRLSVKGVVISGVIMTAMTYFADRLDWAIIVARELGMGLFESYQAIPLLMEMEAIDAGAMADVGGTIASPQGFVTRQELATVAAALTQK